MRSCDPRLRATGSIVLLVALTLGIGAPGLASPGPAAGAVNPADKAKARVLFKQGITKFDEGYYREALALFTQALRLYPNPKIHTRIALCHKWLGNNLKALEHYEKYLEAVPQEPSQAGDRVLWAKVKAEVQKLLVLISQLRIELAAPAGAEVRLNGRLVGSAPLSRLIRLNPGAVNITAIAKGYYTFKRDLKLGPNQAQTVEITMIKIKVKTRVIIRSAKPVWKRWWFWTAIGALVAGGTGLAVGLTVQSTERALRGTPVLHDSLGVRW
jgi:tetratricopeptide (TPR) repeat protein